MICRTILLMYVQCNDACPPFQCLFAKCQSPVFVANDFHVIFVLLRPIFPRNVCFHRKMGQGVGAGWGVGGIGHLILLAEYGRTLNIQANKLGKS